MAIAVNAAVHGDMLFSLPGMFSLNLWTGLPTPTLDNATQWFLSLNETRQTAIREKLRADPRAALIVQKDTLKFLVDHGFRVRGALGNYLGTQFQQAFEVDGYAFWVRRGRTIAPLSTIAVSPRAVAREMVRLTPVTFPSIAKRRHITAVASRPLRDTESSHVSMESLSRATAVLV